MWYENPDTVWQVAARLVHEEGVSAETLLAFFEKPWKWQPEYDAFIEQPASTRCQA